jgi:hypothetical protein
MNVDFMVPISHFKSIWWGILINFLHLSACCKVCFQTIFLLYLQDLHGIHQYILVRSPIPECLDPVPDLCPPNISDDFVFFNLSDWIVSSPGWSFWCKCFEKMNFFQGRIQDFEIGGAWNENIGPGLSIACYRGRLTCLRFGTAPKLAKKQQIFSLKG